VSANLRCTDIELVLDVVEVGLGLRVCHHVLIRMTLVNPFQHAPCKRSQGRLQPVENLCWEPEARFFDVKPTDCLVRWAYQ
jgi:hypothetical protein